MKTILVTGASGFVGRNLVRALLSDRNYQLVLTDKNEPRSDLHAICNTQKDRVAFYNLDILDRPSAFDIFKNHRIDTCIHLAAVVSVEESMKYPNRTIDVNVKGTVNILNACSHNHVDNFLFASSAAVYGHPTRIPIDEEHQLKPISPYGISKLLAEEHVSSYTNSKKIRNSISLRIFNVYGESQFGNESVITKFAKRLSMGLAPIIHGTGMQKRDFVSIYDVVNAMLLSIKYMEDRKEGLVSASPTIFNIGTGTATTIKDLCEQMIRLSGYDLQPTYKEGNDEADINASCADITKAKNFLSFFPNTNLSLDLERIVSSIVTT
jgi:UDP-glucose 4-epimerase